MKIINLSGTVGFEINAVDFKKEQEKYVKFFKICHSNVDMNISSADELSKAGVGFDAVESFRT
jgi:hypothetical protein